MLLQARGRITARDLAEDLEISERTARRDLEALAMSGVPIYSKHGRGGGWFLVGGAKTDLTGLSSDEARALFLAAGPALESTPELKSALRKLTTALPESFREEAMNASAAIKIDPTGWGQVGSRPHVAFLDELTDAVVSSRRVELDYEGTQSARSVRRVDPLGLVTKRGVWYLIGQTERGRRTYRVSRVIGVEVLDERFERPSDFDLDQAWGEIVTEVESRRLDLEVDAVVAESALTPLRWQFAGRCSVHGQRPDGRFDVSIADYNALAFAAQIAGYGSGVELVDPPDTVTRELARIAGELGEAYGAGPGVPAEAH